MIKVTLELVLRQGTNSNHSSTAMITFDGELVSINVIDLGRCIGRLIRERFCHQNLPLEIGSDQSCYERQHSTLSNYDIFCRNKHTNPIVYL